MDLPAKYITVIWLKQKFHQLFSICLAIIVMMLCVINCVSSASKSKCSAAHGCCSTLEGFGRSYLTAGQEMSHCHHAGISWYERLYFNCHLANGLIEITHCILLNIQYTWGFVTFHPSFYVYVYCQIQKAHPFWPFWITPSTSDFFFDWGRQIQQNTLVKAAQ